MKHHGGNVVCCPNVYAGCSGLGISLDGLQSKIQVSGSK